jgi:UDP-N-acetylglucosamine 2-epimerase (non-hydrolysing)
MHPSLSIILGTRPEIIKLAPVIRACANRDLSFSIIHTGQHYSESLDRAFFDQLDLPVPDYNLEVGSATHGRQTGTMLSGIEAVLEKTDPDVVLVQGDTNSVLAGGLVVSKLPDVELGHIEAGLRSYDRKMPEEVNRRLVDHVSDYLFAPTEQARENLLAENLAADRITVTGNTIVDAIEQNVTLAREQSTVREDHDVDGSFALLTAHRAENVDNPERFESLLKGVAAAANEQNLAVVYPVHPRAANRLKEDDINIPQEITLLDPLNFLDFLALEDAATVVFTDSGGVQEESCILRTPCVTLRDSTERPETIDVGANRVVGVRPADVAKGTTAALQRDTDWENPFGDGRAAERILDIIKDSYE